METITYNLKQPKAPAFYKYLSNYTNKILGEADHFVLRNIEAYKKFLQNEGIEPIRSNEEYYVEFVSMGLFIEKYAAYAIQSNRFSIGLLQFLYNQRNKSKKLKPAIDGLRGYLSSKLIYKPSLQHIDYTFGIFLKLLKWLKATGEFNEEVDRLENWAYYFSSIDPENAKTILRKSVSFARYFEEQGKLFLGSYTSNVKEFLEKTHPSYKNREDYLFCGRSEAEYHLNMFGAEVLNRKLNESFQNTSKKVLLLPTCMSNPENAICHAKKDGLRMTCTNCSSNCEVRKINKQMKQQNVETFLIPHSSSFSEFLKYWQNQNETGLIGVACVLNLLTGGYEMQRLNIPSQCVFLNECGCQKHWHNQGIPTSIDLEQLQKIIKQGKLLPLSVTKNIYNSELLSA